MAAIRLVHQLEAEGRAASSAEQRVLARWSSWGAIPDIFDEAKDEWATERAQLRELLDDDAWTQARRTTLNAHFTDPAYAAEMWQALERLGFDGGRVLEPGAGAGAFIGLAPAGTMMTGVELDKTTAAIAARLHPAAEIRAESFAETRFPSDYFDAAIGNVPFADVALHDRTHNPGRHSIHNHFIIKSLAMTRPGGVAAFLTSAFTLDAQNPAARREMNEYADLIGAVRLPTGAHRRSAGTEALTDLLLFRRRELGREPLSTLWEQVVPVGIDGETVKINAYFDYRPDHLLGDLHVGTGMYGARTLSVTGPLEDTPARLRDALVGITTAAHELGLTATASTAAVIAVREAFVPAPAALWDGTITAEQDGSFTIVKNGGMEPFAVPKSAAGEVRSLLRLRDAASTLLSAEAATLDDTTEISGLRRDLQDQYDGYVRAFGPINRFTLRRTGRVDEHGEELMARITPTAIRKLREDPFGPLVQALERFDEVAQIAAPAALLQKRVVTPRARVLGVETPAEAVSASLDQHGRIDLPTIARLLGDTEDVAAAAIAGQVFLDPGTEDFVHAPEYLSGDVRIKLDAATAAATTDPRFGRNVTALREVLPEPLGVEEISAKMGAVWIDASIHQQFLAEILQDSSVVVSNPIPGMWNVRGMRHSIRASTEWGTSRRSALELAKLIMEQAPIKVDDTIDDGDRKRTVFNPVETTAAQEKADKLAERFSEWVWDDPTRAKHLVEEYNRRFNSIALRDYTTAGDYLTFPGLSSVLTPRAHQRAAVARCLSEPAVGLFHEVGAGKTLEMVIATMELRRQGMVTKPAVVVPNHMLEQFTREWLQAYPQARILAASSDDLTGDKRRLFVARTAANDWDAILMTRTAFERIAVSPQTEADYIAAAVEELRTALENLEGDDRISVKRIERAILKHEQDQQRILDRPRDAGITFEETGIDYLVVDEAHEFKNLETVSNIPDARIDGSRRASDLHMKLEWLRAQHGARVVTMATATPLANSVTEAYVMQRYLRPDLLKNAGIGNFDSWAATFGQTVTEMEVAPTGGDSFRLKTRFAKFQNVPEMLRMWHVFADVKTAQDLHLPVPLLREREDGIRAVQTVAIDPGPKLQHYIGQIADRAEKIANRQVTPDEDNMLLVSMDGRKAALDLRMVRDSETSGVPTKISTIAEKVHAEWVASKDTRFLDDATGEQSPVLGGLQIVFSDLGTPHAGEWSAYQELKDRLVDAGLPATSIRFIHEARNDQEKARLFAAARAGHVAVLIGSTQKMGVGTNVQARATALHDMDCPWRPADKEQRHGRIIRQGNQNPEVAIYQYVVTGSFDTYMFQMIERKARFIAQIMRPDLQVREIEDIGSTQMSAAEAKALASGNPLLLEKATADNELSRLHRLERAYSRNQSVLSSTKRMLLADVTRHEADADALRRALPRVTNTAAESFTMAIKGEPHDSRVDAGHALAGWAHREGVKYLPSYSSRDFGVVGQIAGLDLTVRADGDGKTVWMSLTLDQLPRTEVRLERDTLLTGGAGIIQRLENRAADIPSSIAELDRAAAAAESELAQIDQRQRDPFKYADELVVATKRSASINEALAAHQDTSVKGRPASRPEPVRTSPPSLERGPNTGPVVGPPDHGAAYGYGR